MGVIRDGLGETLLEEINKRLNIGGDLGLAIRRVGGSSTVEREHTEIEWEKTDQIFAKMYARIDRWFERLRVDVTRVEKLHGEAGKLRQLFGGQRAVGSAPMLKSSINILKHRRRARE